LRPGWQAKIVGDRLWEDKTPFGEIRYLFRPSRKGVETFPKTRRLARECRRGG